ncbi:8093_t:CDS:2 [Entrophospora sp. SA101]|nr:8093_t:CDS:2 [Entrophospora sp. SA101]
MSSPSSPPSKSLISPSPSPSLPPFSDIITLNVSGVKYKTYRSTLTAYPETLLGTMFQERNKELLNPINSDNENNEYFIDRNGKAFHYVLEYYRNGEILREFDYFQIPIPNTIQNAYGNQIALITLNQFIKAMENIIKLHIINFRSYFGLKVISNGEIIYIQKEQQSEPLLPIDELLPFKNSIYKILSTAEYQIKNYFEKLFKDIKLSWINHQTPLS